MKSDVIKIDSRGNGFREAISQAGKTAVFTGLDANESLDLQLLTEEMLSLVRSVTGEVEASFWIESENKAFELHLTTQTVMDKEKREQLIASSTSRKNEAATGFLGKLRDKLEEAMTAKAEHPENDFPDELLSDLPHGVLGEQEWDGYERSILQTVADQVKIGIRGDNLEVIIVKRFG